MTSYPCQSTRKEVETRQKLYFTVLSRQKDYDHYSGMKEKKLSIHLRVSDDLKFAHFVMMYSAKVHVNINFERFTMQIMLLGRKCYPLDYF